MSRRGLFCCSDSTPCGPSSLDEAHQFIEACAETCRESPDRQLKEMKVGAQTELFSPGFMVEYAKLCGWALVQSHARSGEPAQISGYLGKSDAFDKAVAAFSIAYADQTERDHAIFKKAVRSGQVKVDMEKDRG